MPRPRFSDCDCADEAGRTAKGGSTDAMRSRRGPECLGVRASRPPVVAFVVMNDRPAPRCKRRRYRCAVHAQPIRMSTVRYFCANSLRVSRTRNRKILPSRQLQVQRSNPSRRVLLLIERNILMILFRNRVPVTRGHRATIDRTSISCCRVILAGFFFFGAAFSLSGPVFSVALFSGALLSGTLASGAAGVGVAAGAVPPLGAPCASATPAGRNTRTAADSTRQF